MKLQQIKQEMIKQKKVILRAIEIEKEEWGYTFHLEDILSIIDSYTEKEVSDLDNIRVDETSNINSHLQVLKEIGNIAVIHLNHPYAILTMAILALRTHNQITFYITDTLLAIHTVLLDIIQKVLQKDSSIHYEKITTDEEFYKKQNVFDYVIYFGNFYEYLQFSKGLKILSMFENFNEVYVYVDDKSFKKEFLAIDRYAYDNQIDVIYYTEQLEQAIQDMNQLGMLKTAVIYTKDKEKAKLFLNCVKSEAIYVNQNPFYHYQFTFDERKLLYKKKLMICS